MTHEVFMTAVVANHEVEKARALLHGITEMSERHRFTKVRHMTRNPTIKGLSTIKDLQKEREPNAQLWKELHQIFTKQSYIIQDRVDITDEALAAISTGSPINMGQGKMHQLRFTDWPDPVSHRNLQTNTQRKVIEIKDPRIDKILAQNTFVLKNELIEESYHWWRDGLEYALIRTLPVPADADLDNYIPNLAGVANWPPFTLLFVRVQVESGPDIQQAHALLDNARRALIGIFDFKIFDRRAHDTRITEPRQV